MSDSLWPHGLQHARPPCPSPTPRVYSNLRPSSQWCHPNILSSVVPFSSHLQSFPACRVFSNESVLRIRWPKYWSFSFSISPSNEYSGLISFRMDWLDFLAVQGTLSLVQTTRLFQKDYAIFISSITNEWPFTAPWSTLNSYLYNTLNCYLYNTSKLASLFHKDIV